MTSGAKTAGGGTTSGGITGKSVGRATGNTAATGGVPTGGRLATGVPPDGAGGPRGEEPGAADVPAPPGGDDPGGADCGPTRRLSAEYNIRSSVHHSANVFVGARGRAHLQSFVVAVLLKKKKCRNNMSKTACQYAMPIQHTVTLTVMEPSSAEQTAESGADGGRQ